MNKMQEMYKNEVAPALFKSFGFKNVMQVPRLEKIVVNIGLGEALDNPKALESATSDLMQITGQKPVQTKARKSIANFKLREGRLIGAKVTLRGPRMWAFFDRLVNIALPRVRDFRGVSPDTF
ncbi:MAG TPA: 50S ribosomal protein L5, partial [Anaerolineales bacterium]|nr:50S ribosomal protein L5 [Anaerolineales bacterium]